MIFQHTWEMVVSGQKTQTRRIIKPGNWPCNVMAEDGSTKCIAVLDESGRTMYEVGKTYAVQPGRGKPVIIYHPNHPCYGIDIVQPGSPEYADAKDGSWNFKGQGYIEARIKLLDIRREDVRAISDEDVIAEGFESRMTFLVTWCEMHDSVLRLRDVGLNDFGHQRWRLEDKQLSGGYLQAGEGLILSWLRQRPAERYQAWALTFELVKESQP